MRSYFLLLILLSFCAVAQNKQLLYNVDDLPQTLMSNPGAAISFDKHLGIPLLSGFSVEASSSGVSVYDIFKEGQDVNVAIDQAITDLDSNDYFSINQQLEIISFGWKTKFSEIYYSAGLYQELDAIVYFPKDLAVLAYRGNTSLRDVPINFAEVSLAAEAVSVYHFGINKKVNDKWQVGARAKMYMSIANVNSTDNRGSFITQTTLDGPNFFRHSLRNAQVQANTSGLSFLFNEEEDVSEGDFIKRALVSNNIGFGIDLGVTYAVNDHWTLTGSLIDLGYIAHTNEVENYRATGDVNIDGIEIEFPALLNGTQTSNYWEEFEDEILDQIELEDDLSESYTTARPLKINGSVQYAFTGSRNKSCDCIFKNESGYSNKLGVQLYGVRRPQGLQTAITGYYDKTWASFLRSKLTYTIDKRSITNIGALLSTRINNFNFYLAGDNLLEYSNLTKAQGASLQLGMQLIFDAK